MAQGPDRPRHRTAADGPLPVLDAAAVRSWLALALTLAERSRELVDSFNVFPVPDSDTGTNVVLTLRSAAGALTHLPAGADVATATAAVADGALRGARGNSGLLVSQALAALAEVAATAPDPSGLRPVEMTRAFESVASSTWAAVSHPVPGTLLTVADDAARAAREVLSRSTAAEPATLVAVVATAALAAQESVVETGGLGHGPVDAGAAALMLLLTSLGDVVGGTDRDCSDVAYQMLVDLATGTMAHASSVPGAAGSGEQGPPVSTGEFEVMYLLEATATQAASLRARLEEVGDSVGVVGTPDALGVGLYQVHVHTDTPRAALPRAGRARQVCVHHLHPTALVGAGTDEPPLGWPRVPDGGQVVSLERVAVPRPSRTGRGEVGDTSAHRAPGGAAEPASPPGPPRVGVIACTRAPGLIDQLARTGAVVVLDPGRDGIVRAAGDLGLADVLVLPCDATATAQAHAAARALAVRAAATPGGRPTTSRTSSAPGPAVTAGSGPDTGVHLLVADTDDDAEVLAAAVAVAGPAADTGTDLTEVARRARTATAALRTLSFTGGEAEAELVARTVAETLRRDDELVTVIVGCDALPDVGPLVADAVVAVDRTIEVVVHAGLQPAPDVLVAIE